MRQCPVCLEQLSPSDFYEHSRSRMCKRCNKLYQIWHSKQPKGEDGTLSQKHRATNSEAFTRWAREYLSVDENNSTKTHEKTIKIVFEVNSPRMCPYRKHSNVDDEGPKCNHPGSSTNYCPNPNAFWELCPALTGGVR
jgi:hypothetical protein